MQKILLVGLISVLLAGCAGTDPITELTGKHVPIERIYAPMFMQKSNNTGSIIILRDSGFVGSGCSHDIFVDTTKVLSLQQSEFAKFYVEEGEHILKLTLGYGLCPNIIETDTVNIKPNSNLKYRVSISSDGVLRFVRIQ